jgi:hypothetical protein
VAALLPLTSWSELDGAIFKRQDFGKSLHGDSNKVSAALNATSVAASASSQDVVISSMYVGGYIL